ncbi:MAG TPA: hypothetical protein VKA36_06560 [Solirubrobacterales bacterium]|nr:hypothetical protein [Solirubrobacterales bacterium]
MSEAESAQRLDPNRRVTVEDIRALAGPATPHFALQIRNRIERLIASLDEQDPARAEGLQQVRRLTALADNTGEPRGPGPGSPL